MLNLLGMLECYRGPARRNIGQALVLRLGHPRLIVRRLNWVWVIQRNLHGPSIQIMWVVMRPSIST